MRLNFKIRRTVAAAMLLTILLAATGLAEGPKWIGAFFVKGKVGLKWQSVEGAVSFNVYRKSAAGDYEKIASLEETHHFDTDLAPGSNYTYKISAVGADGTEEFSTEKSVTVPGAQIGEFEPPTWVGLRIDREKIFLNWDPVPGAIAYNIYRSLESGTGYEVIGNVTTAKHADKSGLEAGRTYYYVLTALNEEFEETEQSEEMTIKFGMSAEERDALTEVAKIELEEIPLKLLFDITTAAPGDDMNQPADVALNSKGNIYVTDALNFRVNCYDGSGKYLFSFGEMTDPSDKGSPPPGSFSYPFSLFVDKDDNVYVTDVRNNDIQVFSENGDFVRRIRVEASEGQEEFRPNCIHVLDDGRIVSTDAGNHRFLIIDQDGNILMEKGSRGSEDEQFIFPDGLIVTEDGIVCIVDVINCRIQQFDLEGNFVRNFGEAGQTVGTFGRPKAIALGEDGRLWISDALANAVQVFTMEGEVKSVISRFEDESIFLATPRGLRIKNGRFYIVNRLPNQVMVFEIGK